MKNVQIDLVGLVMLPISVWLAVSGVIAWPTVLFVWLMHFEIKITL